MSYTSYSSVDGGVVSMLFGMLGMIMGVVLLLYLIGVILMIVSMWVIFGKTGEEGWKAIIPFYNNYTLYKIVWDTKFFYISLGLMLGMFVCSIGASYSAMFMLLYYICFLASMVIGILCEHKLSLSFGHGAGFTVGLVLLGIVFYPMLAFGRSSYLGNTK